MNMKLSENIASLKLRGDDGEPIRIASMAVIKVGIDAPRRRTFKLAGPLTDDVNDTVLRQVFFDGVPRIWIVEVFGETYEGKFVMGELDYRHTAGFHVSIGFTLMSDGSVRTSSSKAA